MLKCFTFSFTTFECVGSIVDCIVGFCVISLFCIVHQRAHTMIKALHNYNVFFFHVLASNSLVLPIVLCWVCLFYLLFTNIFSFRFCYFYFVYFTLSCFLKILGSVWRLLEFLAFLFPFVLGSNNSRFFFLHRFRFAGTTARGQTIDQISARAYLFAACVRSKRIWVIFPRNDCN